MNNQKGGIISSLFLIPLGLVLMAGFFFLGYYVGKYQSKSSAKNDQPPSLPELASQYLPNKEDFTFYKTLTDKGDKMVSIDLKPRPQSDEDKPDKKAPRMEPGREKHDQQKPERQVEIKLEKPAHTQPKQAAPKPAPQVAKKEAAAPKSADSKLRYTIQIAAYPERQMAEEEVKGMKKRGYAAFIVTSELPDKGTWHRVRLGSFSNKASAEKLANELKAKEGLLTFITVE